MKDKIIELLKENDRPLRWLAQQLNISSTTLWRKMIGRTEFRQSEILAMSVIFNVDAAYFKED